jgi:hypothetical protein
MILIGLSIAKKLSKFKLYSFLTGNFWMLIGGNFWMLIDIYQRSNAGLLDGSDAS